MTFRNPFIYEDEDEDTIIKSVCGIDEIIPEERSVRSQVDDDVRQYPPLLSIPHEKEKSQHRPASKLASNEDEIKNHLVNERMFVHIQSYENLFAQSFLKLEQKKKISVTGIFKFSLLNENTLELIREGITHHFNQDFIASIHILIPQLENVLRSLVKHSNINILKRRNYSQSEVHSIHLNVRAGRLYVPCWLTCRPWD